LLGSSGWQSGGALLKIGVDEFFDHTKSQDP
jgi:hypothetical protein